jgi:hypothetical protein
VSIRRLQIDDEHMSDIRFAVSRFLYAPSEPLLEAAITSLNGAVEAALPGDSLRRNRESVLRYLRNNWFTPYKRKQLRVEEMRSCVPCITVITVVVARCVGRFRMCLVYRMDAGCHMRFATNDMEAAFKIVKYNFL